jgi:hypothetical protein
MEEFALVWPEWLGTPSQLALLVIVILALIKMWPIIQAKVLEATLVREGRYGERIKHLEEELQRCHEECSKKIESLRDTIMGMRDQRAAEQIAMMRAILRTVESPELRKQLEMLEALQPGEHVQYLGQITGDKEGE